MYRKIRITIVSVLLCLLLCPLKVNAKNAFTVSASCQRGQTVKISISVNEYKNVTDGYDIFRFNEETKTYDLVGTMDIYEHGYDTYMDSTGWNDYYENGTLRFYYDVLDNHTTGVSYIYQVKSFEYSEEYKDNYYDYNEDEQDASKEDYKTY